MLDSLAYFVWRRFAARAGRRLKTAIANIERCADVAVLDALVTRMTTQAIHARMTKRTDDETAARLFAAIAELRLADLRMGAAFFFESATSLRPRIFPLN